MKFLLVPLAVTDKKQLFQNYLLRLKTQITFKSSLSFNHDQN